MRTKARRDILRPLGAAALFLDAGLQFGDLGLQEGDPDLDTALVQQVLGLGGQGWRLVIVATS